MRTSLSPPVTSAVVLFLGAAYAGCPPDLRVATWACVSESLTAGAVGAALLDPGLVEDACAGVRLMLGELLVEDASRFSWLLYSLTNAFQQTASQLLAAAPLHVRSLAQGAGAGSVWLQPPVPTSDTASSPAAVWPGAAEQRRAAAAMAQQRAFFCAAHLVVAMRELAGSAVLRLAAAAGQQQQQQQQQPQQPPGAATQAMITALMDAAELFQYSSSTSMAAGPAAGAPLGQDADGGMLACCCTLAASGMLEGLLLQLRQLHGQQQQAAAAQLQRLVAALTACVQAALGAACNQAATGPQPGAHAEITSRPLPVWAAAWSYCRLRSSGATAALLPRVEPPGPLRGWLPPLACRLLLEGVLGLEGLALHAMQGAPPAAASAWLQTIRTSLPHQDLALIARCIVDEVKPQPAAAAPAAAPQQQQQQQQLQLQQMEVRAAVLTTLHAASARAMDTYSAAALVAPTQWLSSVDGQALRDVLDKQFVCTVTPLAMMLDAWQLEGSSALPSDPRAAGGSPAAQQQQQQQPLWQQPRSQAAVVMLAAAANLAFCRVQLPLFQQLLQRLVPLAASSPAACDALLRALPCYESLLQPVPGAAAAVAAGDSQQHPAAAPAAARWRVDAVIGAKLMMMMPAAVAALQHASDLQAAASHLLPYIFLLAKSPQGPLATMAHAAFASLATYLASAGEARVVQQALPYYVQRSLQGEWSQQQMQGFVSTLPSALAALPPGCPTAMHCARMVCETSIAWLASIPAASLPSLLDFSPLYQPHNRQQALMQQQKRSGASPAVSLISCALSLVLLVDFEWLEQVSCQVGALVCAVPPGPGRLLVLQHLHDLLLASDDYVRKAPLAAWFLELQGGAVGRREEVVLAD